MHFRQSRPVVFGVRRSTERRASKSKFTTGKAADDRSVNAEINSRFTKKSVGSWIKSYTLGVFAALYHQTATTFLRPLKCNRAMVRRALLRTYDNQKVVVESASFG